MPRKAWLLVSALLLGWLVLVARPFVAEKRDYPAGIPSPAAVDRIDDVPLVRGTPVCVRDLALEKLSEEARFRVVVPPGRSAGPLRFSLVAADGSGYAFARDIPRGLRSGMVAVLLTPPTRPTHARACFENNGPVPVRLSTANDRARSRSDAIIRGRRTGESPYLSFWEATPRSVTERLPETLRRMSVFRPGFVSPGFLWALLALVLFGVPAGLLFALHRSAEGAPGAERFDVNRRRPWWDRW